MARAVAMHKLSSVKACDSMLKKLKRKHAALKQSGDVKAAHVAALAYKRTKAKRSEMIAADNAAAAAHETELRTTGDRDRAQLRHKRKAKTRAVASDPHDAFLQGLVSLSSVAQCDSLLRKLKKKHHDLKAAGDADATALVAKHYHACQEHRRTLGKTRPKARTAAAFAVKAKQAAPAAAATAHGTAVASKETKSAVAQYVKLQSSAARWKAMHVTRKQRGDAAGARQAAKAFNSAVRQKKALKAKLKHVPRLARLVRDAKATFAAEQQQQQQQQQQQRRRREGGARVVAPEEPMEATPSKGASVSASVAQQRDEESHAGGMAKKMSVESHLNMLAETQRADQKNTVAAKSRMQRRLLERKKKHHKEVDALFTKLDADGSGSITREELQAALPNVDTSALKGLLTEVDKNGDGVFTHDEVKAFFPQLKKLSAAASTPASRQPYPRRVNPVRAKMRSVMAFSSPVRSSRARAVSAASAAADAVAAAEAQSALDRADESLALMTAAFETVAAEHRTSVSETKAEIAQVELPPGNAGDSAMLREMVRDMVMKEVGGRGPLVARVNAPEGSAAAAAAELHLVNMAELNRLDEVRRSAWEQADALAKFGDCRGALRSIRSELDTQDSAAAARSLRLAATREQLELIIEELEAKKRRQEREKFWQLKQHEAIGAALGLAGVASTPTLASRAPPTAVNPAAFIESPPVVLAGDGVTTLTPEMVADEMNAQKKRWHKLRRAQELEDPRLRW